MTPSTEHYSNIEWQLVELLQKFAHRLSRKDFADVAEFLEAGEYGLALESIVAGTKTIDPMIVRQIDKLAESMQITGWEFVKDLHANAISGELMKND